MDRFIEECSIEYERQDLPEKYNKLETMNDLKFINVIIIYKSHNEHIYKKDIPLLLAAYCRTKYMKYEKFIDKATKLIKKHKLEDNFNLKSINNLSIGIKYSGILKFYYLSTFLEYEPDDIKIALKD